MSKKKSAKAQVMMELGELIALSNDSIATIKRGGTIDLYDFRKSEIWIVSMLVAVGKLAREETRVRNKGLSITITFDAKIMQDLAGHLMRALAGKGISIGFLDAAAIIKSLVDKLSSRSKKKS